METPNATAAGTGSGKTAEQVEFEAGAKLKRAGAELPERASDAARKGYESAKVEVPGGTELQGEYPEQPGTAKETEDKCLSTHRVAPKAQTDRPEPVVTAADAEDLNPNEKVSITKEAPGKRYFIEGRGASVDVNFEDVTPESLIAVTIDHLQGGGGDDTGITGGDYARNAVKELRKALDWLHQGTRNKFERLGVTDTGANPVTPAPGGKPIGLA
jgi:hypothetical protein